MNIIVYFQQSGKGLGRHVPCRDVLVEGNSFSKHHLHAGSVGNIPRGDANAGEIDLIDPDVIIPLYGSEVYVNNTK